MTASRSPVIWKKKQISDRMNQLYPRFLTQKTLIDSCGCETSMFREKKKS